MHGASFRTRSLSGSDYVMAKWSRAEGGRTEQEEEGDDLFRHRVTVTENRIHAKTVVCVKAKNSVAKIVCFIITCTEADTAVV